MSHDACFFACLISEIPGKTFWFPLNVGFVLVVMRTVRFESFSRYSDIC